MKFYLNSCVDSLPADYVLPVVKTREQNLTRSPPTSN